MSKTFSPNRIDKKSNKVARGLGAFVDGKCCGQSLSDALPCSTAEYEWQVWDDTNLLLESQFAFKSTTTNLQNSLNNEYLDASEISRMLTRYGVVCVFRDDILERWLVLPCMILRVSVCNKPTAVKVYSATTPEFQRELYASKDEFFVIWDSIQHWNVRRFFWPWVHRIAEIETTIDVNLFGLRTPVVGVNAMDEKLSMNNIIYNFIRGIPFINVKPKGATHDTDITQQLKCLDLKVPYNIDKLEIERQKVWNRVISIIGYKTNINDTKKERLISDEVMGNAEEIKGFYAGRKNPRETAVEWMLEHDIGVKLQEVTKVGEIYDSTENSMRQSNAESESDTGREVNKGDN